MPTAKWSNLDPRARRALLVVAMLDGALRAAALMDLRRRSSDQVRGSKRVWALAITVMSSAGVLPLVYFVRGRRRTDERISQNTA